MGWAKYTEDNNEMIFERLTRMNDRSAVIEVTAVIPLPTCSAKISRDITVKRPQTGMRPKYEDKILYCKDCGDSFVFSTGEQDFYRKKICRSQNAVNVAEQSKKSGGLLFGEEAQNV